VSIGGKVTEREFIDRRTFSYDAGFNNLARSLGDDASMPLRESNGKVEV
jgi:hypothetical protein